VRHVTRRRDERRLGRLVAAYCGARGDDCHGTFAEAAWSTGDTYFGIPPGSVFVSFDKNAPHVRPRRNSATLPTGALIARGANSGGP
jgi:hypothetical protein